MVWLKDLQPSDYLHHGVPLLQFLAWCRAIWPPQCMPLAKRQVAYGLVLWQVLVLLGTTSARIGSRGEGSPGVPTGKFPQWLSKLSLLSEPEVAGWQTESEDESVEHLNQIGRQNQMQFLQQVMGHQQVMGQQQPNPFPQVAFNQPASAPSINSQNPNFQQFYDVQFNQQQQQQQMMYWQPAVQQPQQPLNYNQQMQMQMQQAFEQQPRLPLQSFPEGMMLVVVPVVPGAEQQPGDVQLQPSQPQFEMDSRSSSQPHVHRALSVSSTPSEISTEMGSSVSTVSGARSRRLNNKESEAVVRQLQTPGLDPVQRKRLLKQVAEDAWTMAITKQGTRVVQAALEAAELSEKMNIVAALRGRVW
eukprot:g29341.t1